MRKNNNIKNIATGLLTGICNGLFGAGGGMIAVFALESICAMPAKKAHATAISIMLPLTVVSLIIYLLNGKIEWDSVPFVAPAVFIGSIIGARLLSKLQSIWINRVFSVLMLIAGVWMIV